MSIVTLCMAIFLVSMHACHARNTIGFEYYNKIDGMVKEMGESTKLDQSQVNFKAIRIIEDMKESLSRLRGGNITLSTMTTSDESQIVMKSQGLRRARSILGSETQENKEATTENESVEDAVVMDYVTPHRKAPIHNHH